MIARRSCDLISISLAARRPRRRRHDPGVDPLQRGVRASTRTVDSQSRVERDRELIREEEISGKRPCYFRGESRGTGWGVLRDPVGRGPNFLDQVREKKAQEERRWNLDLYRATKAEVERRSTWRAALRLASNRRRLVGLEDMPAISSV